MESGNDLGVFDFDGGFYSWKAIFDKAPNFFSPGGVLLFFGGKYPREKTAAALGLLLLSLADQKRKPIYHTIKHLGPEKVGRRKVLENIDSAMRDLMKEQKFPENHQQIILQRIRAHRLLTLDGLEIREALRKGEEETATIVSCAQLYRFAGIKAKGMPIESTTIWSGLQFSPTTEILAYLPHLVKLTRHSLAVAKERKQFICVICESYGIDLGELPSDIKDHPDLTVFGASDPNKESQILSSIPQLLSKAQGDGIELAVDHIKEGIADPLNCALLTSQILFSRGKLASAWKIIEPYLETVYEATPTVMLMVAQTALGSGNMAESSELIRKAVGVGLTTLENLNTAYVVATELELDDLATEILEQMISFYPKDEYTLMHQFGAYFKAREFSKARGVADEMGDEIRYSICNAFSHEALDLTDCMARAAEAGKSDYMNTMAAQELEFRREYAAARYWAARVPMESEYAKNALKIRTRVFGKLLRQQNAITDDDVVELESVMRLVALHPDELDLRFEIERQLEGGIEEAAALLLLAKITLKAVNKAYANVKNANFDFKAKFGEGQPHTESRGESIAKADYFFRAFCDRIRSSGYLLGRGGLPADLRDRVNVDLLFDLVMILQHAPDGIPFQTLVLWLHCIAVAGKTIGEPSSDFIAARFVVSKVEISDSPQAARDLAETILLSLPNIQSQYLSWRIGQGWACYSDAFLRSGNIMAALRCICMSFLACEDVHLSAVLFASSLRLAARILRDLRLGSHALEILSIEREFRQNSGSYEAYRQEIDHLQLSIKLSTINQQDPTDYLINLLSEAYMLLLKEDSAERAPVLSCMASIIRMVKLRNVDVPCNYLEEFNKALKTIPPKMQTRLQVFINVQPSYEELSLAIRGLDTAFNLDDLAYQMAPLHGLATAALASSCEKGDINLFFLASLLISQPVMYLYSSEGEEDCGSIDHSRTHAWWARFLSGKDSADLTLQDAQSIIKNASTPDRQSISGLAELSIRDIQAVVQPTETVMLLTLDSDARICWASFRDDHVQGPFRLPNEVWSPSRYFEWRKEFPVKYGSWSPQTGILARESISKDDVIASMRYLSIPDPESEGVLTIIGDAHLFGFPFGLLGSDEKFLGERVRLCIAPSVPWLISKRAKNWNGNAARVAWLGSPDTTDFSLLYLRDRLESFLSDHSIEVLRSDVLPECKASSLVVLTSHGGLGYFDQFRSVSDDTRSYTSKNIASRVHGSGCVVLFICSAGRSDPKPHSSETMGLVSELLRADVRCVVAPYWPLSITIPEVWLPVFWECFCNRGEPVVISAFNAAQAVCKRFDNPCAWGALQVFGDPYFSLNNPRIDKSRG